MKDIRIPDDIEAVQVERDGDRLVFYVRLRPEAEYVEFTFVKESQRMNRCVSDRPYHCGTHDRQWIDDESDRCEYQRMVDAEAAIQRVRDVCENDLLFLNPIAEILRVLDGLEVIE